jgi:hypothetical protein
MNTVWPRQVSRLHSVEPSDRSASNHPLPPSEFGLLSLRGLPRTSGRRRCPRSSGTDRHLGFAFTEQARRGNRPNRVRLLRTGRSPPVALHPASQRRSYLRLQSPDRTLAGTLTPPIPHAHRRTRRHAPRVAVSEKVSRVTDYTRNVPAFGRASPSPSLVRQPHLSPPPSSFRPGIEEVRNRGDPRLGNRRQPSLTASCS